MDFNDAQSVVEIFAEATGVDCLLQVAVRGGDHSHISLEGARLTNRQDFVLVKDAEQFHLQGWRRIANFVKEDRPPLRLLKEARPVFRCACKRAGFVAEQRALQKCLRQCSASSQSDLRVAAHAASAMT